MKNKLWFIVVLLILFCFNSCTENPFFKEDKISAKKITGTVELSDLGVIPNVVVWFELLNLATRTDADGNFELTFPSSASQPGGGLDGFFKLYFYVANYKIETREIMLRQGVPQYASESLNANGKLTKKVVLQKLVEIKGAFLHEFSSPDSFLFQFTVKSLKDPVNGLGVFSRQRFRNDAIFGAGFIKKAGADNNTARLLLTTDRKYEITPFTIDTNGFEMFPIIIYTKEITVAPDEYEILPYLLIDQPGMPAGLWDAIGGDVKAYKIDHLNIPITMTGTRVAFVPPPPIVGPLR